MDSYSGSEPRLFISFRLGNESNGQPPKRGADEEKPESSDSFVTAASNTENQTVTVADVCCHGNDNLEPDSSAQTTMSAPAQGEMEVVPEDAHRENEPRSGLGLVPEVPVVLSTTAITPPTTTETLHVESSSTDESCGAYIARKWEQLGCVPETGTSSQDGGKIVKTSESFAMELAPTQDLQSQDEMDTDSVSEVAFLDPPKFPLKSSLKSRYGPPEAKIQKLCVKMGSGRKELSVAADETGRPSLSEDDNPSSDDFGASNFRNKARQGSSNQKSSDTGQDSEGAVGSTFAPANSNTFRVCDTASNTSVDFPEVAPRVAQLSANSRALIKEFFEEATPVILPAGHSTLALNEGQVCQVLKVVADEAVKSSLKAMENLIQQASRLSLGTPGNTPCEIPKAKRPLDQSSSLGSQSGFLTGNESDTSGVLRSGDDFASIGYVYEHSDLESHPFTPPPVGPPGCSRVDPMSHEAIKQVDSPGAQTLAGLKAEAIAEKSKSGSRKKQRKTTARKTGGSGHRVPRGCKIMKEAYFKGMEWTKTFVSGPVDPRWNPYKFYCQICKGNVSIYGRGAREILRHHATERHLRKDQRWRYEHLAVEDPVTKTIKHHVRGRDGRRLTPYELQLELPNFIGEELIDIGEKLPFYDAYLQGTDYMASSSENRARVQVSVLGNYLRSYGDIGMLRNFWRDVGVVVNHQSLFTDFNWSKERLSVRNSLWSS